MRIMLVLLMALVALTACGRSGGAASCLPAAWRAALPPKPLDLPQAEPLAVASDGQLLIRERDNTVLQLVGADGKARPTGITVSSRTRQIEVTAAADESGHLLVEEGVDNSRQPSVPFTTAPPVPAGSRDPAYDPAKDGGIVLMPMRSLTLLDVTTGTIHLLVHTTDDQLDRRADLPVGALLRAGHVYWAVYTDLDARRGRIEGYDTSTGRTTIAATGPIESPQDSTADIDRDAGGPPSDIPSMVRAEIRRDDATASDDGADYAWATRNDGIGWMSATGTTALRRTQHAVATLDINAVSGPFVFFHAYDDSDNIFVMDVRTGGVAATGLTSPGFLDSRGRVMVFGNTFDSGHTIPIRRIDTSHLPAIHC